MAAPKHFTDTFSFSTGSEAQQMMHSSAEGGSVSWWKTSLTACGYHVREAELVILLKRDKWVLESNLFLKKLFRSWTSHLSLNEEGDFSLFPNSWLHFGTDKFKQDENQIASAYLILSTQANNVINVAVGERKSILEETLFPPCLLQILFLRE